MYGLNSFQKSEDILFPKIYCDPILLKFNPQIPEYKNSVMVARNPGSVKKATSYAERLRVGIAVIHGEVKEGESDEIDGRYSPPLERSINSRLMDIAIGGVPPTLNKEKPPLTGER